MIQTQMHVKATPDQVCNELADDPRYAELVVGAKASLVRFELTPDEEGTTVVMRQHGENAATRLLMRAARPLMLARNAETLWRLREQVESEHVPAARLSFRDTGPLPRWLADSTARFFGAAAAIRRQRPLHPRGVTRCGVAHFSAQGAALGRSPAPTAVVRFSRGAGLPAWLPDVNGVAIRLVDARGQGLHRDILFARVGPGVLRHVLVPSLDFASGHFSSLLPYRLNGDRVVLTARVEGRTNLTLDRLRDPAPIRVAVCATRSGGESLPLLTVDVRDVVDGRHLRFDPGVTDAHLVPLGFLHALRDPAYAASQAVRAGVHS